MMRDSIECSLKSQSDDEYEKPAKSNEQRKQGGSFDEPGSSSKRTVPLSCAIPDSKYNDADVDFCRPISWQSVTRYFSEESICISSESENSQLGSVAKVCLRVPSTSEVASACSSPNKRTPKSNFTTRTCSPTDELWQADPKSLLKQKFKLHKPIE